MSFQVMAVCWCIGLCLLCFCAAYLDIALSTSRVRKTPLGTIARTICRQQSLQQFKNISRKCTQYWQLSLVKPSFFLPICCHCSKLCCCHLFQKVARRKKTSLVSPSSCPISSLSWSTSTSVSLCRVVILCSLFCLIIVMT